MMDAETSFILSGQMTLTFSEGQLSQLCPGVWPRWAKLHVVKKECR